MERLWDVTRHWMNQQNTHLLINFSYFFLIGKKYKNCIVNKEKIDPKKILGGLK